MIYDVFISYRRDGGFQTAKHLYDLLVWDGYSVSFDIDTLREGDFNKALLERIKQCTDFVLVVDEHCFDKTLDGSVPLEQDWLRQEVACALKLEKNIVSILLAGASFPNNLPEDIAQVAKKNGPEYSKGYFDSFYANLKGFLHALPRNKPTPRNKVTNSGEHYLKVSSDLDCVFYLDGEKTLSLKAGIIQKIPLGVGEYELSFVSEENEADCFVEEFVMPAYDKIYKVVLQDIRKKRIENEIIQRRKRITEMGALPGVFSVSPTKRVRFSPGYLEYYSTKGTWQFSRSSDYEIFGPLEVWNEFAWGTGNNPTKYSMYPDDFTDFVDWGQNKITNGGNQSNFWHTPTIEEWDYLLFRRKTNSNCRFAKATIAVNKYDNKVGMLLFPDNWERPRPRFENILGKAKFQINNLNDKDSGFSCNTISIDVWHILEEAGLVFLPALGRQLEYVNSLTEGRHGFYWSASSDIQSGMAFGLEFLDGHVVCGRFFRNALCRVRLVCPAEN